MNVLSSQPAETHVAIEDSWLVANGADKNAVWEAYNRDNPHHSIAQNRVQRPRSIMVGTTGNVRGYLWGENTKDTDDYYLVAGTMIQMAFRCIYAQGTTARGIKIFG